MDPRPESSASPPTESGWTGLAGAASHGRAGPPERIPSTPCPARLPRAGTAVTGCPTSWPAGSPQPPPAGSGGGERSADARRHDHAAPAASGSPGPADTSPLIEQMPLDARRLARAVAPSSWTRKSTTPVPAAVRASVRKRAADRPRSRRATPQGIQEPQRRRYRLRRHRITVAIGVPRRARRSSQAAGGGASWSRAQAPGSMASAPARSSAASSPSLRQDIQRQWTRTGKKPEGGSKAYRPKQGGKRETRWPGKARSGTSPNTNSKERRTGNKNGTEEKGPDRKEDGDQYTD